MDDLDMTIEWAETAAPIEFDSDFLYSLQESREEYGSLTHAQEHALQNIIKKWKVGDWYRGS